MRLSFSAAYTQNVRPFLRTLIVNFYIISHRPKEDEIMKTFLLSITCAAVLVFGGTALATTIHVPADQPTIQAGIDAASNGDTVLVADGTYTAEGYYFVSGKAIVVKSENGAENCIIDFEGGDSPVLYFDGEETSGSVVDGFTIKNSGCTAIICESSTIINNILIKNGCGIHCSGSSGIIKNNIIAENHCGIDCFQSSALIIGNQISNNSAGGGIRISYGSSPTIKNNIIANNTAVYGGGVYCFRGGTYEDESIPSIINNTIIGNSSLISVYEGDDSPTLSCEYDRHNRIYECFIDEARLASGGGIYINSCSAEIMNNIIAFSSKELSESSLRLGRWYYDDLFMRFNYEGASLKSVTYYYGFVNCGDSGDVHLSGCTVDTSFTIQSGERYWMETTSFVDEFADGGGIDLTIRLDNESLNVKVTLELYPGHFGGCYFLYNTNLQSYGIEMSGAGIVAIGDDSFPNIAYNDIYGNEEGNYLFGATSDSTYEVDLTGIDGNISQDPLCEAPDYLLSSGSPCIDAGNPDPLYNDASLPPGMGTERCDMGAYGGPENDIITIVTSVKDYTAILSQFLLYQNYPNPFNSTTIISYQIPKSSFVKLYVYDIKGRLVETLVNEHKNAGYHSVEWNSENVGSGIFFYRIDAGEFSSVKKCLVVK